jgi:DNA-binding transcriptional MerR regulator
MKHNFTIGEISKLFGIGTDSIRYYEELGAINPTREENNYRLYSIMDIWRLNVIRDLRSLKFSIKHIEQYLNNRSIEATLKLFEKEQAAIEIEQKRLSQRLDNVTGRIANLRRIEKLKEGKVRREKFGVRCCYMIQQSFQIDEEADVLIQQLMHMTPKDLPIIGNNLIGARLPSQAVEEKRYNGYDAVFIIDEKGDTELSHSDYLCVCYHGSYKKNALYVPMLLDYAACHKLHPVGDILEILMVDNHTSSDLDEQMTELQLPIELVSKESD